MLSKEFYLITKQEKVYVDKVQEKPDEEPKEVKTKRFDLEFAQTHQPEKYDPYGFIKLHDVFDTVAEGLEEGKLYRFTLSEITAEVKEEPKATKAKG